jgi:predicted DNA-binding transcriptional regulator AlpA
LEALVSRALRRARRLELPSRLGFSVNPVADAEPERPVLPPTLGDRPDFDPTRAHYSSVPSIIRELLLQIIQDGARKRLSDTVASMPLVGVPEIARRLGVDQSTVYRWRERPDFPSPLEQLASGSVWDWADIEQWSREVRPTIKAGRPPKNP